MLDDDAWPHTVETKEETIFVVLTKADYRRTCQAEFESTITDKIHSLR